MPMMARSMDLDYVDELDDLLCRSKKYDIRTPDVLGPIYQRIIDEEGDDLSGSDCSVCLEDIDMGHAQDYTTHCGHVFCSGCLTMWIEQKKACPMCRAKLTSENEPGFVEKETVPELVMDVTISTCMPIGMYCKLLYFEIWFRIKTIRASLISRGLE